MNIEFFTLFMTSIGLSMDAFAVSVTNGLCYKNSGKRFAWIVAAVFGLFQGGMAIIGFFLGGTIGEKISEIGYVVAFVVLAAIGVKMIWEAVKKKEEQKCSEHLKIKELFVQAVATSLDSLAVGISFAVLSYNIFYSSVIIAAVTFVICFAGVLIGKRFGNFLEKKAVITGGIILILIGIKILLENIL